MLRPRRLDSLWACDGREASGEVVRQNSLGACEVRALAEALLAGRAGVVPYSDRACREPPLWPVCDTGRQLPCSEIAGQPLTSASADEGVVREG